MNSRDVSRPRVIARFCSAAVILVLAVSLQAQRVGTWQPIGPYQATVFTIQFDSESTAYAGTYFGGLYRSSNLGASWTAVSAPFSSYAILSIGLDPNQRQVFYVGTLQHGVFATQDGGLSWQEMNQGLKDTTILSVEVDPFDSKHLLAATGTKLHASIDGGENWEESTQDVRAATVLMSASERGTLYVGTFNDGVLKSIDGGLSFSALGEALAGTRIYSLATDADGGALLAATSAGVFRLPLGAEDWTDISYGQPAGNITQVIPIPGQSPTLMGVSSTGVYISVTNENEEPFWFRVSGLAMRLAAATPGSGFIFLASLHGELLGTSDGGRSFVPRMNGMQNSFVGALTSVPSDSGGTVLAGTDLGVYRLESTTSQWAPSGEFGDTVFELQPDPHRGGVVYAGTEFNGVYESVDEGKSWKAVSEGIVPVEVNAILQGAAPPYPLFAGTSSGLYRRLEGADVWTQISPSGGIVAAALDPADPRSVLVGSGPGQISLWDGAAEVFRPLARAGIPLSTVVALAIAPQDKYYAVLDDGFAYAAPKAQGAWFRVGEEIPETIVSIAADPRRADIVLMGTAGGGIYRSEDFGVTWTPAANGLAGSYVLHLAADSAKDNHFFAATEAGVFRSVDSGVSWHRAGEGLPSGAVLQVSGQDGQGGGLFASVLDRGLFRLNAESNEWESVGEGLPQAADVTLGVHPFDPEVLYAATPRRGIFRSGDGGRTWSHSSQGMSVFVRGIAVDTVQPQRLYAASLSAGVFQTSDGGANWEASGLNDRTLYRIAQSHDASSLFAATSLGVSRSDDQGLTWEHTGQQTPYVLSLAADPNRPNVLYLGALAGEVYRTDDGGDTWTQAGKGLPQAEIVQLAVDPKSGAIYAAARLHGVFKSTDEGQTWTKTATIDGFTQGSAINGLCVDGSGAVYAAGSPVGAFRSLDGGETWAAAISGLRTLEVTSLYCSQGEHPMLAAGTLNEGVFFSTDQADSWYRAGSVDASRITSLANSFSGTRTLYAGTESGLFLSRDTGGFWQRSAGLPLQEVAAVTIDSETGTAYAAFRGDSVYKSVDGGVSWQALATGVQDRLFTAVQASGSRVLVGTQSEGVIRSQDGGQFWTTPASPATVRPITLSIAVHPHDADIVYAGTAGHGVLKSEDRGLTWRVVSEGMDSLFVLALAIDTEAPQTVYAGTNLGGVFVSNDGGENWSPIREGMFNTNVTSLLVDPEDHRIVYAGCEGGGVFRIVMP